MSNFNNIKINGNESTIHYDGKNPLKVVVVDKAGIETEVFNKDIFDLNIRIQITDNPKFSIGVYKENTLVSTYSLVADFGGWKEYLLKCNLSLGNAYTIKINTQSNSPNTPNGYISTFNVKEFNYFYSTSNYLNLNSNNTVDISSFGDVDGWIYVAESPW